jgi:V8-like Glu-specific endopeptidase
MSLLRGTAGSIRLPPAGSQVRNPTRHPPSGRIPCNDTGVDRGAARISTGTVIDPSRVPTAAHRVYNPYTQHNFLPAAAGRPLH